jgi:FKBP-type peptidyl-prolyl cis-trans isomerase
MRTPGLDAFEVQEDNPGDNVKRTALLLFSSALVASVALAAPPAPPATKPAAKPEEKKPLTAEESKKALYTFGTYIAQRTPLGQADLTPEELATVLKGFTAAALNKPLEEKTDEAMPKVDQLLRERQEARGKVEKTKGGAFLEAQAKEAGAQRTASGLIYFETLKGAGATPAATDTVRVHYKGTLIDGKEFDSSYKRNAPAEFPLNGVIKCWTEGVSMMRVGGKARLVCPPEIAYGERGMGGAIPPNAVLVFEVELLAIPSQDAGK